MAVRRGLIVALAILSCTAHPALAADLGALNSAKAELSGVLYDIEGNLVERDAIAMNAKDLEPKARSLKERMDDYRQREQQFNGYCQGTYPEPEYSRRKAYCDGWEGQLRTLFNQLDVERQEVARQYAVLQQRDTQRQQKWDALQKRMEPAVLHLVMACMGLGLPDQKAYCHMPAAPGPRTREMVASMESVLVGKVLGGS